MGSMCVKNIIINYFFEMIRNSANSTESELKRIRVGLEVLYINLSKFIIIFILSIGLNIFNETFIVIFSICFCKTVTGGVHASNSLNCLVISAVSILAGATFSKHGMTKEIVLLVGIIDLVLVYKYAPCESKKNPIKSDVRRKILRKESVKRTIIIIGLGLIVENTIVRACLIQGLTIVVVLLLPQFKIIAEKIKI